MWLKASWRWLAANKEQLTILFALVAGGTALYQYLESVDDGRKKETLKYVEWYQDERVGKARQEIFAAMDGSAYADAANKASAKPPDLEPLKQFVKAIEMQMLTLTEHYMNLTACVDAGICHEKLACQFYRDD